MFNSAMLYELAASLPPFSPILCGGGARRFGPQEAFWASAAAQAAKKDQPHRLILFYYTARVTLPERRHLVHTYTCLGVPLTIALTRFTLGFQGRLERRWEWETWMPNTTPLSQNSHLAIRYYLLARQDRLLKHRLI